MVTLTIIALLIFVPASRRFLAGFITGILGLLGLGSLITRNPGSRRRGL
jgi:hypothetical protein